MPWRSAPDFFVYPQGVAHARLQWLAAAYILRRIATGFSNSRAIAKKGPVSVAGADAPRRSNESLRAGNFFRPRSRSSSPCKVRSPSPMGRGQGPLRVSSKPKRPPAALTARLRSTTIGRNSAMALAGFKIIDADGHVTEPASLYSTHIDPKFRAAADALLSRVGAGQSRNRSRALSEVAIGGTSARRGERSSRPRQTAVGPQPSAGFARGRLRSGRAHPRHGQGRYRRRGLLRDRRDFGVRRERSRDGSCARARLQPMGRRVLRRVPVANQGGRDRSAARDGSMRRGGRVSGARAVGGRHHDLRQSRRDAA